MIKKRRIRVPRNCQFCNEKFEPDYNDVATISRYVSDRGRILGRDKTGICAKHQRKLAKAIKRSRDLAMMPFVSGL